MVAIGKILRLDFYHQLLQRMMEEVDLRTGGVYRTPLDLLGVRYSQQLQRMTWKVAGEEWVHHRFAAFHSEKKEV